jgi:hypothetical protein
MDRIESSRPAGISSVPGLHARLRPSLRPFEIVRQTVRMEKLQAVSGSPRPAPLAQCRQAPPVYRFLAGVGLVEACAEPLSQGCLTLAMAMASSNTASRPCHIRTNVSGIFSSGFSTDRTSSTAARSAGAGIQAIGACSPACVLRAAIQLATCFATQIWLKHTFMIDRAARAKVQLLAMPLGLNLPVQPSAQPRCALLARRWNRSAAEKLASFGGLSSSCGAAFARLLQAAAVGGAETRLPSPPVAGHESEHPGGRLAPASSEQPRRS